MSDPQLETIQILSDVVAAQAERIAELEASQEETRRRCQQLILEGHCREDAVIWIEEALGVTKETDK